MVVATYGFVFEAEFAAATLEEAGIPARVSGPHTGIFGPGFQGYSLHGVELLVPWHRAGDAAALLRDVFGEGDEDEPEDDDGEPPSEVIP